MSFIWFVLIGLAAGWLAGQLMRGGGLSGAEKSEKRC